MNLHVLLSVEAKAKGVIGRDSLMDDEAFLFEDTRDGAGFHMRGVPFDIDIAFLDKEYGVLAVTRMASRTGTATAPEGCAIAVEAAPGFFDRQGVKVGDIWTALANKYGGR